MQNMTLDQVKIEIQRLLELERELRSEEYDKEKQEFEKSIVRNTEGEIIQVDVYVGHLFERDIEDSVENDGWILGFRHAPNELRKTKIRITVIDKTNLASALCKNCNHDLSDREIELEADVCSLCDGECHCKQCEASK